MSDNNYNEGYRTGEMYAEHHYKTWQDTQGPPFPWPQTSPEIHGFVEECLPIMQTMFARSIEQDMLARGLDPRYTGISRELIRGVDGGYRSRLTVLVTEHIKQESYNRSYRLGISAAESEFFRRQAFDQKESKNLELINLIDPMLPSLPKTRSEIDEFVEKGVKGPLRRREYMLNFNGDSYETRAFRDGYRACLTELATALIEAQEGSPFAQLRLLRLLPRF